MGKELVLVKWHGDVIAVHADAAEAVPARFAEPHGVTIETHAVPHDRASLGFAASPTPDARTTLGVLVSIGAHVGIALVVFASFAGRSARDFAEDDASRAALVQAFEMRIAENADRGTDEQTADASRARSHGSTLADDPEDSTTPVVLVQPTAALPPHRPAPVRVAPAAVAARAPVTSHARDTSSAPSQCVARSVPANDGPMCTREVVVTSLESPPSCFTDTVVARGQHGTVRYPCQGDGEATLTMGSRVFRGVAVGGRLDVCTGTEFPWSDGCTWTSAQRLSGSLAPSSEGLTFTYGEAPKVAAESRHACAPSCAAHGTVRFESTGTPI
jgi:hypothetical protein